MLDANHRVGVIASMTEKAPRNRRITSHCNECGGERNHEELCCEKTHWEMPIGAMVRTVTGGDTYQMLKCKGCDSISFRHSKWCSEWDDVEAHYYPPEISRSKPSWWEDESIPQSQQYLLTEIYEALHNSSLRLAVMGIRSLIESVMVEKVGDNGTFGNNLAEFSTRGWLSEKQKETLEKIIDVGHAATHRDFSPSREDLGILMDIAEALVVGVYVHPLRGANLGRKIPPRMRRSR
jgi:hypothetical protein